MERQPQRGSPSVDRDGIRVVSDERTGLRGTVLLVAIIVPALLAGFLLLRRADSFAPPGAPGANEPGTVANAPRRGVRPDGFSAVPSERKVTVRRAKIEGLPKAGGTDTSSELEPPADIKDGPNMDAGDFIAALRESGETAGLAAFSLPGKRPPVSGVIVPADYELPEGFARHYQSTDDGGQLEPILVVAPGYEILDDAGDPVALMEGRVVPPEYVPSDLPVQMLYVPSGDEPGEDTP